MGLFSRTFEWEDMVGKRMLLGYYEGMFDKRDKKITVAEFVLMEISPSCKYLKMQGGVYSAYKWYKRSDLELIEVLDKDDSWRESDEWKARVVEYVVGVMRNKSNRLDALKHVLYLVDDDASELARKDVEAAYEKYVSESDT